MKYKDTLNLPKTKFPMKANLARREPAIQAKWDEIDIYGQIREARKGKPQYVLHDGPPYATGDLHIGTVMNKVLKDIVVRYKTMCGLDSPFVPGWDCHGLPIEHKVMQALGEELESKTPAEIRKACREYAQKYVNYQREQFKRFGVFGDWANPYLTMTAQYEAGIINVFGKIVENGFVYKDLRPIHWCHRCETALAEAELEYADVEGPSIYVRFEAEDAVREAFGLESALPIHLLIWTTTPWTLPANVAVAFGPQFEYAAVEVDTGEILVLAAELVESVMAQTGHKDYKVAGKLRGEELEGMIYHHPFVERQGRIILADFVSLESGTGMVHIAPGHGKEDYEIGLKYKLPIISPVDEQGRFTEEFEKMKGVKVFDADSRIIEDLKATNALFYNAHLVHSYPHCWRCKSPLIFRATRQWFISIEHSNLRSSLIEEIKRVTWIPDWGKIRIMKMVEGRPDWCVSRQRVWGVPIPALSCRECQSPILVKEVVDRARDVFAVEGADSWFKKSVEHFLPEGFKCPICGSTSLDKESDILDVWFESGASYHPVVMEAKDLSFPADLYLEGSDQHRGWFQSSLITSTAAFGHAPYKSVLTHGFVVDEEGKKMSKSLGNFVSADDIISKFGADVMRLWISSVDYRNDISTSEEIIGRAAQSYKKLRFTFRYLLGCLRSFDPRTDAVDYDSLLEIDRWALAALQVLVEKVLHAYEEFDFHMVYAHLYNFCAVQMSSFWFDVLKDRLYTAAAGGSELRSAHTAMSEVLHVLLRLAAPVLVHTCEEAWEHVPGDKGHESIHLTHMPKVYKEYADKALIERYERLFAVREEVLRKLEALRVQKVIGSALEAQVRLCTDESDLFEFLSSFEGQPGSNLETLFIVSKVELLHGLPEDVEKAEHIEQLGIEARQIDCPKCERCWNYRDSVGKSEKHPTICARCVEVVEQLQTEDRLET
jgi:isoleucyl-tRNA synthetase